MASLDQKLRKQLLLKMVQNSRRRQSLMLKLTLFLKSGRHLLIQLAFSTARHTIRNKLSMLSNLEFHRFLLEVSICCTMEIYNEGSDISSCPNTTYKNLDHLQNQRDKQPCWKKIAEIFISRRDLARDSRRVFGSRDFHLTEILADISVLISPRFSPPRFSSGRDLGTDLAAISAESRRPKTRRDQYRDLGEMSVRSRSRSRRDENLVGQKRGEIFGERDFYKGGACCMALEYCDQRLRDTIMGQKVNFELSKHD